MAIIADSATPLLAPPDQLASDRMDHGSSVNPDGQPLSMEGNNSDAPEVHMSPVMEPSVEKSIEHQGNDSNSKTHYLGLPPSLSPKPSSLSDSHPPDLLQPANSLSQHAFQPAQSSMTHIPPLSDVIEPPRELEMTDASAIQILPPAASATIPEHVEQPMSNVRDDHAIEAEIPLQDQTVAPIVDDSETRSAVANATEDVSPQNNSNIGGTELDMEASAPVSTIEADPIEPPSESQAADEHSLPTPAPQVDSEARPNPSEPGEPREAQITTNTIKMDQIHVSEPGDGTSSATVAAENQAPVQESMELDLPNSHETVTTNGATRQREEDEGEEPSAKRLKVTDQSVADDTATFKVPNLPPISTQDMKASDQSPEVQSAQDPETLVTPTTALSLPADEDKDGAKSFDNTPMTKDQRKFLMEQLRKAKKVKFGLAFIKPVDAVALNIPNYYNIITSPMDLSTMETKLKEDKYATVNELVEDVRLMVSNAIKFNGVSHDVSQAALNLRGYIYKTLAGLPMKGATPQTAPNAIKKEQISRPANPRRESRNPAASPTTPAQATSSPQTFAPRDGIPQIRRNSSVNDGRPKREIHKPPPRDLPYTTARPQKKRSQVELKFCEYVLKEMYKAQYSQIVFPFYDPVDPIALSIPNYFQVIKKPMDMYTINNNLKSKHYASAKEFKQDMEQMFANCFKFNPPSDNVHQLGKQAQEVFHRLWDEKTEWIRNNQPPSEPSDGSEDDDEDEEEEEEEDRNGAEIDKIAALQAQMAALHDQLSELVGTGTAKKAEKRSSPSAKGGKKVKKDNKTAQGGKLKRSGSLVAAAKAAAPKVPRKQKIPVVTQAQKREVSDGIANLDNTGMQRAVQIIRNGVPALQGVNDDELELDIDEIPNEVVWELYQFVVNPKGRKSTKKEPEPVDYEPADDDYEPPARQRTGLGATTGNRKKNKPMTASEQERKIKELQDKVQSFDSGVPVQGAVGGASSEGTPAGQVDSDDDDEDSESEEE